MLTRPTDEDSALFQALVENGSDVIVLLDAKGCVQYTSRSVERVLGYTPQERLNHSVLDCVHEDDVPLMAEALARSFLSPGLPITLEFRVRHKDGSWRHIEAIAANRLLEPAIGGIVVNYRDLTERKALEEQLRQSQKMEAVGRLARGIAHDFNNVLAAILGNSDLIQLRLKPDDPLNNDVQEIAKAAERGASLTRQLIAFSRRQALQPELLDLHAVVRSFDTMLQRLTGDIVLRLETPGPSPLVRVEPGQIEQVIMNLVVNARDATTEGGTITVQADQVDVNARTGARYPAVLPGRYGRIMVHDTGSGIDPELQRHLFEPFFTTKDPAKGSGLGLSIVYGIAKEAGGTVTVSSAPGRGTTLEVLIPRVDATD